VTGRNEQRALVLSYSDIETDPRVRREVDWLTGAGWVVDTLGLGDHPGSDVRDHFPLGSPRPWAVTKWGTLVSQTLIPRRRRFRLLLTDRVPREALDRLRRGDYDLVVFNEYEFLPWVLDPRDFTPVAMNGRRHLDIHEYRNPEYRRRTLGARLTARHYRWVRRQIGNPAFTSRTVVNAPIGDLYVQEFGIAPPVPVRNIPPFVDQAPQPVDRDDIRMLFHGLASWQRGFTEILQAMRTLPERFSMTFMLMPNPTVTAKLLAEIDAHPARDRIRIVPPAPMREIAQKINEFDLEIIFYRPLEHNLLYALPNKFFESVQGRLGVVIGESPAMAEIVREHGFGIVVPGFEASDLAAALNNLTAEDVGELKSAADRAAHRLNAETEGRAFIAAIDNSGDVS
jgi:glycosyltransferase involved in cell wall biosynthesis